MEAMKGTLLAAAAVVLAIGGCAHSRSAMPPGARSEPVGIEPTPSIYDTINRGTSPAMAKATLPDPDNPNWSGAPAPPGRPEAGPAPKRAVAAAAAPSRAPLAEPPRESPAVAYSTTAAADPAPTRTSQAAPAVAAAPAAEAAGDLPPAVEADPTAAPPELPELPDAVEAPPADAEDPLLGPSPELMPAVEPPPPTEPAAAAPAVEPADEDPLLGPAPELMPAVEPEPEPAAEATPKPAPAPAPALEPAGADEPGEPEPAAPPSAAAPPLEPAPSSAVAARSPIRRDAAIRQVSTASAPPSGADVDDSRWKEAGRAAARVGDEVITLRELVTAVNEFVRKQGGGKASQLPPEAQNQVAQMVLASLIERTLVVQEAKRQLKDEKNISKIRDTADQFWRENEMPHLLRQYGVQNERELRRKYHEGGRTLADVQSDFRQDFIAHSYVMGKIGDKIDAGLPDMLKYYEEHKNDPANHRSPVIVWREILVDKHKHASPAEARAKIDAALARIRKGEDFAAVARAESEGPSRITADGGLMETAPGSYVVAAVNQALDSLPLNAVGDVVEGPDSFHVLRVESRRGGGPASFAELQDQIRAPLRERKLNEQRQALTDGLRKQTVVTTIFDGTASDPNRIPRRP